MRRIGLLSVVLWLTGCAPLLVGGNRPARPEHPATGPCSSGGLSDTVKITVPGHPFEAIASADGCWVFASLLSDTPTASANNGSIAVFRSTGAALTLERVVPLSPGFAAGMALSHDGALLIVADDHFVKFLDARRLVDGTQGALLGSIRDAVAPGSVYLAISDDDRTLFVSDEEVSAVTVIDLQTARQTGFHQNAIIGRISTGRAPVGLAFSRDGRHLFITSEVWPGLAGWPSTCGPRPGASTVEEGAIEIVDVARARLRPIEAVVGRTPAGCSPVRAVLSADGSRLYVSARGSNAVLVFDAERLVRDPAGALLATVPVGTAPVGLEVMDHGHRIVVANSNRFGGSGGQDLTVLDASKVDQGRAAVMGSIRVGEFPRELHAVPDGQALLVTDYGSDRIELIPSVRLEVSD